MRNEKADKPVLIAGTGKVACVLLRLFAGKGITCSVWGRDAEKVSLLAEKYYVTPVYDINKIYVFEGIIIFCVPDEAAKKFAVPEFHRNAVVLVTSGSLDIRTLTNSAQDCGVFYPLNTFVKANDELPENTPVIVEYTSPAVYKILLYLSNLAGLKLYEMNYSERIFLHIAAVFANNFTVHFASLAKMICDERNIDFDLLRPLIEQTMKNLGKFNPHEVQTGPAVRNDIVSARVHYETLSKDYPLLAKMYSFVTESIIEFSKNRNEKL